MSSMRIPFKTTRAAFLATGIIWISTVCCWMVPFFFRRSSTPGQSYGQQTFFFSGQASSAIDRFYNLVFKFDQNIGSRHRISFRNASNDRTEIRPTNGIANGPGADGQLPLKRINDTYVIDWVATVSSSMIFNLPSSFSPFVELSPSDADAKFDISSLRFPAA